MAFRELPQPTPLEIEAGNNLEKLSDNPYPGRGIVLGHNENGDTVQVYWLMGRSDNSRNRVLVQEGYTVKTDLWDATQGGDRSLIIYNAMRKGRNDNHIVSNGDQTDTIAEHLATNPTGGFEEALETREFEPDAPNFTPRISGTSRVTRVGSSMGVDTKSYNTLSVIKRGEDGEPVRTTYPLKEKAGIGYCVHTYEGNGNPLPSFDRPPYAVPLKGSGDQIANTFWDTLNYDNRVSLVVKTIGLKSGEITYSIRNKLSGTPSSPQS